jgi:hypothetical protein
MNASFKERETRFCYQMEPWQGYGISRQLWSVSWAKKERAIIDALGDKI